MRLGRTLLETHICKLKDVHLRQPFADGNEGRVIGMKTLGAAASLKKLQRKFGFEPERTVGGGNHALHGLSSAQSSDAARCARRLTT
jgi:hypothetical protein